MKSNILTFTNFSALILSGAIFLLFIAPLYAPITMSGWVFFGLVAAIVKREPVRVTGELLLPLLLYALYTLSVLWSQDKPDALFDLEVKMSLAIVPFMFMIVRYEYLQIKIVLYAFLTGLVIGLILIFSLAILIAVDTGSFEAMFYTALSPHIHPSYFSFYVNIAMGLIVIDYATGKLKLFRKKWIYIMLFTFLSVASMFLLSKLGVVTTILLCLSLLGIWLFRRKFLLSALTFVLGILLMAGIYSSSNFVQGRIDEFVEGMSGEPEDHYLYSTSVRIEVWKVAWDNYLANPIVGYGNGDVDEVMQEKYLEKGIKKAPDLRLNAHNQFLQTGLATGIFGILLLLMILALPIRNFRKNYMYGMTFSLIALLFFLTESVLETQAGVLGFIFFYCIFNSLRYIIADSNAVVEKNAGLT